MTRARDMLPPVFSHHEYPALAHAQLAARPKFWTQTASGGAIDLDDPKPEQIRLTDIAIGLAHVCRWNGQTPLEWRVSVAEHSVIVAQLALHETTIPGTLASTVDEQQLVRACLFHDAHEAYPPGDVAGPVKAMLRRETSALDRLLAQIQRAIEERFGIVWTDALRELVHTFDLQSRWLERAQVLMPCDRGWGEDLPKPRDPHPRVRCMSSTDAAEQWLDWCSDYGVAA